MAKYYHHTLIDASGEQARLLLSETELHEKLAQGYAFPPEEDKFSDVACPALHSGRGLGGGLKVDSAFNDILNRIKTGNSVKGGWSKSTITTK